MRLIISNSYVKTQQNAEKIAHVSAWIKLWQRALFFSSSRNILLNKQVFITIKSVSILYLPRNEPEILFFFTLAYKKTPNNSLWIIDKNQTALQFSVQLKDPALFPASSLKHVIELVHNFVISNNVCKILIFSVRWPENTIYFLIQMLLLLVCHIQRSWQLTWQIQPTGCNACCLHHKWSNKEKPSDIYMYCSWSEVVHVWVHQK